MDEPRQFGGTPAAVPTTPTEHAVHYPVMLDLRHRRVAVVGGGTVAEHKARGLIAAGARVRVISPAVTQGLRALADDGAIEVDARPYWPGDLDGATLAIAATDDPAVNRAVQHEADAARVLVNVVDNGEQGDFVVPSVHRRGDVTVTVSTAGQCPTLAVRLRERIGELVRDEHATFARLAGSRRAEIARRVPDDAARRRLWYRIVDSGSIDAIARGDVVAAWHIVEALVREAEDEGARAGGPGAHARSRAFGGAGGEANGIVYLVGAGPGDPRLITLRGLELLCGADAIVHDRLIGTDLLTYARPTARVFNVGKHGHDRSVSQDEINALLIEEARHGRRVVRLKGGDSFVFGRGAEECEALRRAGIRFEVVPGVSSAIAAPEAAGIPLTHREFASGFAVVTGHQWGPSPDDVRSPALDWAALARMPTLVVLMGLRALPRVAEALLAAGADPETPAAVISKGTYPEQRVVTAVLRTVATEAAAAALEQPATLVVGDVVRVRELIDEQQRADAPRPLPYLHR